ncbi:hypothetical protein C7M84_004690 [Penaeus vannamei]|uniref:Uncharacterized protein n=1 Tax=Penaeus vannamei TaxID=6689 RepID=A0A3R7MAP2_PENVA|nr:hypothetical protein C7M84_004690 [Penaeus vannamei]
MPPFLLSLTTCLCLASFPTLLSLTSSALPSFPSPHFLHRLSLNYPSLLFHYIPRLASLCLSLSSCLAFASFPLSLFPSLTSLSLLSSLLAYVVHSLAYSPILLTNLLPFLCLLSLHSTVTYLYVYSFVLSSSLLVLTLICLLYPILFSTCLRLLASVPLPHSCYAFAFLSLYPLSPPLPLSSHSSLVHASFIALPFYPALYPLSFDPFTLVSSYNLFILIPRPPYPFSPLLSCPLYGLYFCLPPHPLSCLAFYLFRFPSSPTSLPLTLPHHYNHYLLPIYSYSPDPPSKHFLSFSSSTTLLAYLPSLFLSSIALTFLYLPESLSLHASPLPPLPLLSSCDLSMPPPHSIFSCTRLRPPLATPLTLPYHPTPLPPHTPTYSPSTSPTSLLFTSYSPSALAL